MIRFSKFIWLYALISALVIVPGVVSLALWGFKPSIDFVGGTMLEVRLSKPAPKTAVTDAVRGVKGLTLTSIQQSGSDQYTLRFGTATDEQVASLIGAIDSKTGGRTAVLQKETVGPVLGKELLSKAVTAAVVAIFVILGYVAYAFKNYKFGVSAIIALVHDMLVMCGVFSLLGHFQGVEVDTLFVTAFLTTMSFSVHDTIVIFDRIREYRKRDIRMPFAQLSDMALTETIGRSLVNSFTIIFMLLALVLMGGETVKWFAVALLVGTVTGTYSSPFVATPVLYLWDTVERRRRQVK